MKIGPIAKVQGIRFEALTRKKDDKEREREKVRKRCTTRLYVFIHREKNFNYFDKCRYFDSKDIEMPHFMS